MDAMTKRASNMMSIGSKGDKGERGDLGLLGLKGFFGNGVSTIDVETPSTLRLAGSTHILGIVTDSVGIPGGIRAESLLIGLPMH